MALGNSVCDGDVLVECPFWHDGVSDTAEPGGGVSVRVVPLGLAAFAFRGVTAAPDPITRPTAREPAYIHVLPWRYIILPCCTVKTKKRDAGTCM